MTNFSPEKYILKNGRKLPIEKCLVADAYDEMLLTLALIIRRQPSNYFSFAFFMIDRHCLGVKSTITNCNVVQSTLDELISRSSAQYGEMKEVSSVYFHNLVFGAVDYAESIGFKPRGGFDFARFLLQPELVDDGIDDMEFGYEGKPNFIAGPDDNVDLILNTLNRTVGEGNYNFTYPEF